MGLISEFRDFAMKGNVVDMAVGVIIGGAFGKIVSELVDKVMMPPIGYLTGGIDFKDKVFTLLKAGEGGAAKDVVIGWGAFTNSVIQFIIVAFCLFMVVKAMLAAKSRFERQKAAAPPPPPPADVVLLSEIRDLLKKKA
ncbi:MAG: large-conductance mechanosensitive channel protein MscL [Phycisphaerae bacterium]|nr:large-conductance mechanosensitive channel protein MscL [Phycisphaerae bacterium]